ncbi:hypothetical protein DEJ21_14180 [Curtobacterium sp. MCSS17_006]|nr:hypothetical protein DEJ21_14180 [Curtobacterium sp. MCSS17_006]
MWFAIIGDLDVEFAYQAGVEHFQESTEYLKPAHIVTRAKRIARENVAMVREGKDRGVVPLDWPDRKPLPAPVKAAYEADRAARQGMTLGSNWFPDSDTYRRWDQARSEGLIPWNAPVTALASLTA